jgi:hypothetical protein
MKNLITSKNEVNEFQSKVYIDNYIKEYDIKLESDSFKTAYINSNTTNKKNTFEEARSKHLVRKDIEI